MGIDDLKIIIRDYSEYIDEKFVDAAKIILKCFEFVGDDLDANKINDYFQSADYRIISLSNYFKKHFSIGSINRHYFAYSIAYFDPSLKTLDLNAAFGNLKSVYEIVHYTKWLTKKFDYLDKNNCMFGLDGCNNPEEKYRDLANAVLSSISNADDDVSKEANSYISELKEYMNPESKSEQEMFSAFCKLVKRAIAGKKVERIEYIRPLDKNKKGNKSDKNSNLKKSAFGKIDKGKLFFTIGVACIIIASIIVGTIFAINHFKTGKNAENKLDNTITAVSESATKNQNVFITDIEETNM